MPEARDALTPESVLALLQRNASSIETRYDDYGMELARESPRERGMRMPPEMTISGLLFEAFVRALNDAIRRWATSAMEPTAPRTRRRNFASDAEAMAAALLKIADLERRLRERSTTVIDQGSIIAQKTATIERLMTERDEWLRRTTRPITNRIGAVVEQPTPLLKLVKLRMETTGVCIQDEVMRDGNADNPVVRGYIENLLDVIKNDLRDQIYAELRSNA